MRCPKCGKTLDASAKICPVCRTQIASVSAHSSNNSDTDRRPNTAPARAVVEPSGSVGGSGTHRCPKCGKTLDASAKICPVCRTQIASASAHSSNNSDTDRRPNTAPARAVAYPSGSVGGTGTHRCPKCGKTLDASAKICPVCRTQIASVSAHSSTVNSSGYAQRQPEPAVDRPQPVNIDPSAYAESAQPQSSKKRSKKPVAIAVAIASAAAVIAIAVIGLNLFKKDKDEGGIQTSDSQSYETVDSKLSEVLSDSAEDSEKLRQQVGSALDDLAKNGMVKDVRFVDQTGMYEFTYDDGTQGGVMLEPFKKGVNGTQKSYVQKQSGGKVESYDNNVKLDKSKYSYSKDPKVKIMYGLGFDDVLSSMKERNNVWKNEGLSVDMDVECTVKDFANDLDGYDYIQIEEHGTIYDNVPVICLDEDITDENRKEYSNDLKAKNIAAIQYLDKQNRLHRNYWIKPSFFKEHYGSKGLSGSIIYLGCCRGYMKKDLVEAIKGAGADTVIGYTDTVYTYYDHYIQDAFVYSLMYGDTVSEALKYAEGIWGTDDIHWFNTYYSDSYKVKSETAKPKVLGNTGKTLVKIKSAETTTATTKKPEEKPVPDKIKEMLEYTDPDYRGQPGGPAAAFMTYYGYRGHEGTMQDEMWFQDMDGDNIPDLVVGGYSAIVDGIQGRVHCFEIQLSKGNGGGTIHLLLDYSSKGKHGHEAFKMQAYKDNNGSLLFTHTDFYAYTSPDPQRDPNYAGAFTIYEYSFANRKGEEDKKQILYYTYDPKLGSGEDAFSCSDSNGSRITAANAKKLFNNYYASKTPLKANIKTINYQNYMNNMSQEQRKQALMDSYYAFSYTENKSIAPYGKEVFDKMPSAATTTTTTKKPQQTGADIYASYASAVESFKSKHSDHTSNISYFVYDIDSDNSADLVVWDMQGFSVNRHVAVYKYDTSSHQAKLYAEGEMGGSVGYSKKSRSLVSFYSHGRVDYNTCPSGMYICVTKGVISGGKISDQVVVSGDSEEKKAVAQQYETYVEQGDAGQKKITASDIKANAAKNKAA